MKTTLVALALLTAGATAHASTMGLLGCTKPVAAFSAGATAKAPGVFVAHDAKELAAAWRQYGMPGSAPSTIDYATHMVVGVANPGKTDRVIYRIELDNAAAPTALLVRLAPPNSPCGGSERTPTEKRVHAVVTPRTALPVKFVVDAMIDGRMYVADAKSEGVETTDLATVAAVALPATVAGKATTREAAEKLAIAALAADEKTKLVVGPLDRKLARIPHGWTKLAVATDPTTWTISYDTITFKIDRATGAVTR